jgi:exopolysaccharide biosynthesis polyprenyl glycosylphosphotransferase
MLPLLKCELLDILDTGYQLTDTSNQLSIPEDADRIKIMTRKGHFILFSVLYVIADVLAVILAFLSAYYVRFSGHFIPYTHKPSFTIYFLTSVFSVPIFLILFRYFRLYFNPSLTRWEAVRRSIYAVTIGFILFLALTFFYRQEHFFYSRVFIFICWFLILFYFNLLRQITNKVERRYIKAKGLEKRVVILGVNKIARRLIRWLKAARYSGYRVVGVYSMGELPKESHIENCEVLGSLKNFKQDIERLKVDEVILSEPHFSREETVSLMLLCESRMINFRLVADIYGMVTSSLALEQLNNVPILGLRQLPLDDLWCRIIKRAFDIAGSFAGLLVMSPLFLILPFLIKSEDKGPIFYAQERVGRGGKVFKLLKFRTMKTDAETRTGPVWATADDERKTRIGSFLRKTNLDEIPQLWNVFKGEMSLVGPRPERPFFVEQFKNEVPRYMARHRIKPGITGWAQVHGYRGDAVIQHTDEKKTKLGIPDYTPYQYKEELQFLAERIQLDLYYIENWSLLFDIEILFRTFFAYQNAF